MLTISYRNKALTVTIVRIKDLINWIESPPLVRYNRLCTPKLRVLPLVESSIPNTLFAGSRPSWREVFRENCTTPAAWNATLFFRSCVSSFGIQWHFIEVDLTSEIPPLCLMMMMMMMGDSVILSGFLH